MPKSKVAVMFPGQGAFDGAALASAKQRYPHVAQTFKEIDEVSADRYGRRLTDVIFDSGSVDIRRLLDDDPWVAQLAIFGSDVSAYRVLADHGLQPAVLLGHSLGEIAALVAARAFTVEDGARIVAERVQVIQDLELTTGGMVALSIDSEKAAKIIELVADPLMAVATENHDGQTVISGPRGSLERVLAVAGPLHFGAVELNAPFPFHTPILRPAVPVFAERIRNVTQHPMVLPVFSPILHEPG
jgi:acyl transferase domain-containing protein